jgi:hypothetical protein
MGKRPSRQNKIKNGLGRQRGRKQVDMENLIKALQIFLKYGNPEYPTWCEHDTLHICKIDPRSVSKEDIETLENLGFRYNEEYPEEGFYSFRYGSA